MDQTIYYQLPNGGVGSQTVTTADGTMPVPPDGATVLMADQYQAALAAVTSANAQALADVQAAEAQARHDAYEALLTAGIPDASARLLSGYQGQEES